jgi:pimeloyl-ACP methyl ester carboxylesterase
MIVHSSDGVEVAVHDLAGHDGAHPALLMSHATGFHGRCYLPLADALADRFHSIGFDYRGHGDTVLPPPFTIDWNRLADDAEAVALSLTRPLAAFGHSMGGACLVMVAHRHPELFSRLVLYEPVILPSIAGDGKHSPSMLIEGARRRRASFESFDTAIATYASKPPLSRFTPAALDAYVRYGFSEGEDGQVHLKCRPEVEAATFEMARSSRTWDVLPEITVPVLVVTGLPEAGDVSEMALGVADRLPNGRYLQLDDLDHFGPATQPAQIAEIIADFCH